MAVVGFRAHRPDFTLGVLDMQHLIHWFTVNASLLAILVTVGVAVLLVCCLGCSNCPSREKDDLFRRHGM
jgi:heterodisulfide reductase subunit B